MMAYPEFVGHWLNNDEAWTSSPIIEKYNPADGSLIGKIFQGSMEEVKTAVDSAKKAFKLWSSMHVFERSRILLKATQLMEDRQEEIADIVALETGKSKKDALGEVGGAIRMGFYWAGEGERFFGYTTTSASSNRFPIVIRVPVGVAVLIISFNTPIANVAWKAFPCLLCGNAAIMKPSEYTALSALWFAKILKEAGLPPGVFSVIQGDAATGKLLVYAEGVHLISYTGSESNGRYIAAVAGQRGVKVSLELGGRNAMVVCDDADIEWAVQCAIESAFSNAGERCAAMSRMIIDEKKYNQVKKMIVERTKILKLGTRDSDAVKPVISEKRLDGMIRVIHRAAFQGSTILAGGYRVGDKEHGFGYYLAPTVFENISMKEEISRKELFGPITGLYSSKDFRHAISLANDADYILTGAIHTKDINRAYYFIQHYRGGVVVNGRTYGFEPNMEFGSLSSGNGFREPGIGALDVYTEKKPVYIHYFPDKV